MFKKLFLILTFFLINGCAGSSTAFLGPVFTGAKTGSISQSSLSYGSGKIINQINPSKILLNNNSTSKIKNIFSSKVKNSDIPYIDENPVILISYKVDFIEFSEVVEPEPLP